MELDILEKMRKYKEEKEAQAAKDSLVTPSSAMDKGKGPMEEIPQVPVAQQVKSLIHTAQHLKKKAGKDEFCARYSVSCNCSVYW